MADEGRMTHSTYEEIDLLPSRVSVLEQGLLLPKNDTTDRSAEILAALTTYGECRLDAGVYYVSGLEMPEGSKIIGAGENTIIRLASSVTNGYCVRIHRYSTIQGVTFSGGTSAPANINTDGAAIGTRHGVYLAANADGSGSTHSGALMNIITECRFEYFDGAGFFAENTGGGLYNSVIMDKCIFYKCMCGIDMHYYSEYAKFSDCVMYQCNVACINNGGNNIFSGCTFHGVRGFVIDNTNADKTNNSHGSCIGCVFNHINNQNMGSTLGGGKGVEIINAQNGFVFSGCQLWYCEVSLIDSRGVMFSDCLFGGNATNSPKITVSVSSGKTDYGARFESCDFHSVPVLSVTANTQFIECYNDTTGEAIGYDPVRTVLAEMIDTADKNLLPTGSGTGTRYTNINMTVPVGKYVLYFGSITSNDTDASTCQIGVFTSSNTAAAATVQCARGSGKYVTLNVISEGAYIRVYASDTHAHGDGDTITFSDAMLCKKEYWDISRKYIAVS